MQYCLPEPLKTVNPKGGFLVRPPFCTFPQTSGDFFVAKSGLKWVRSQLYQGNFCPRKKSKTHGIFSQISDFTVTKYSMKLKCCQWPEKFLPPQTAKAGRLIESVPAFAAALTASPTASSLGITDKFSHPSSHICAVLSSSTNPRRSTATPVVCLLAEPSKSQVRRTQVIGQRLVCENVPRMQARSAPHDWLTLTAIDTAHLCKSGRLHFISVSLEMREIG